MHSPRGMTLVGAFLQLTLSSDKISTLRRPILLLKLDLVNEEGKREEVTLELDDAELKELVNELGDVNKVSHTVGGLVVAMAGRCLMFSLRACPLQVLHMLQRQK